MQTTLQMRARGEKLKAIRRKRRGRIALEDRSITAATRQRYFVAVRKVFPLLETSPSPWDEIMVDWIEQQYNQGESITSANDTLCGLHHFAPFCKGKLIRAWKLFRVWRKVEKPRQAPPFPFLVFLGVLGRCMRRAVDENVVIYEEVPRLILATYLEVHAHDPPENKLWPHSPECFRRSFREILSFFKVEALFRPYSLRRGGATEDFRQHGLMEKTLIRGRWGTSTAARQYIQEGLSALTTIRIKSQQQDLLLAYGQFYFYDLTTARSDPGSVEEPAGGTPEKKAFKGHMAKKQKTKAKWLRSDSAK